MPITDLTGYTWVGNDNLTEGINASFYISFISNSTNFTSIDLYLGHYFDGVYYGPVIVYTSDFDDNRSWTNDAYKTIQITGGTDATNSTLIAWLEANGTLTAPIQANTYNLTHTLTNLTKGNITLQITPDTNYTYPTSLTISNGTIVSYDNTTGVAVISGDDTTIVSGECVEQASGYEVELYGQMGDGEVVYVQINDDPTWYYAMMAPAAGFVVENSNIPNAYDYGGVGSSIRIPNVSKIKFGVNDPADPPYQLSSLSTGDFTTALTFNSTGSSNPAYATNEITMTQDSSIAFEGDD